MVYSSKNENFQLATLLETNFETRQPSRADTDPWHGLHATSPLEAHLERPGSRKRSCRWQATGRPTTESSSRAVNSISMPIPLPLLVPPASAWREILQQIMT